MAHLQMLDDRVSVIAEEVKKNMINANGLEVEATGGGVIIPDKAKEEARYFFGKIVNVGKKTKELKVGNRV